VIEDMIERYNLSPEECYDIPDPQDCPECGQQTLFPNGSEMENTDADGRRGIRVYYSICSECGFEGASY
jgi:rubredoxin